MSPKCLPQSRCQSRKILGEFPPIQADGHFLLNYHLIALKTGVTSLTNGSARVNVGKTAGEESGSGTEVIAAVKLGVESVLNEERSDDGRIVSTVSWFVLCSAPCS